MAKLCLSLTETTLHGNLELIRENMEYIDICELRADCLDPEEYAGLASFPAAVEKPVILTLRRIEEGGAYAGSPAEYEEILLKALTGKGYGYLDLDRGVRSVALEKAAADAGITIIRSYHNFDECPSGLASILKGLPGGEKEIPKIACMVCSTDDLFRLHQIALDSKFSRQIVVGMGPMGVPARLLPDRFRSYLSYSTAGEKAAAPGHFSPKEMCRTYRFHDITAETAVYGIVGNPVLHSKSPEIHNPGFARSGIDAVYVPFQTEDPETFFAGIHSLGGRGFSVTVPHKQAAASIADLQEEAVQVIGSCNTMVRNSDNGTWNGYNTDYTGFLRPLGERLEQLNRDIGSAVVFGAGGAARGIVYALVSQGLDTAVINRTPEKAKELADRWGLRWGTFDEAGFELTLEHNELIVQTTTAGMEPDIHGDPWPEYYFSGEEMVYEIIYTPKQTTFVRRALAAGCEVIFGEEMLKSQAETQFRLFTGKSLDE